ncbi:MAG: hypothetical protein RIQ91_1015, partial [Bacteroidota bacterium]
PIAVPMARPNAMLRSGFPIFMLRAKPKARPMAAPMARPFCWG